jgi:DNA-binding MarR family transcriptional regulator
MPTISRRAILNNAKLTGAAISLREGIAYYCNFYEPWTDVAQTRIGELVGLTPAQVSRAITELEEHQEIKKEHGRIYLLKLDDKQLNGIAERDFHLLKTLADLGCEDARPLVAKMETMFAVSEKGVEFLLHFFMFSNLPNRQTSLPSQKHDVADMVTIVADSATPFKGLSTNNFLNNDGVLGEEEEENVSCRDVSEQTGNSSSSSGGAAVTSEDLRVGDTDEPRADAPENGKNHEKRKEIWVQKHERGDIKGLERWLDYLESLPELENVSVRTLWKKYDRQCKKRHSGAAERGWFLKSWLFKLTESVQEKLSDVEEEIEENAIVQGSGGGKTSKQKRDEYAIREHEALERNRLEVEERRAALLRESNA